MCGISAAIIRNRDHQYWDLLRASEIRGQDGTGYVIHKKGKKYSHKSPFKASLLTSFPQLEPGDVVVGQNRLAIFGLDHSNDQPLESGCLTLVHNGNLYQFEEVFERGNLVRRLQVDTELILRLIERELQAYADVFLEPVIYSGCVERALVGLKGNWACLMYDQQYHYLVAFTYEKPLYFVEVGGNTYFFSTERIGQKVFSKFTPIQALPNGAVMVLYA